MKKTDKPISFEELAQEMRRQGFKITSRTIRKYTLDDMLMPDTVKAGGYRQGVKRVFPDRVGAIERLRRILELRGKGYTIFEILRTFEDEDNDRAIRRRKNDLKCYILKNGRYYYQLTKKYNSILFQAASNITELFKTLLESNIEEVELFKVSYKNSKIIYRQGKIYWEDLKQIEKLSLFHPTFIYKDKFVYNISKLSVNDLTSIEYWYRLKREYKIDFYTLVRIHKRLEWNLKKYFFLPEPDGERFSNAMNGWKRQAQLNKFIIIFFNYLDDIGYGRRVFSGNNEKTEGDFFEWNSEYLSVDEFISDFLNGKCAFVPAMEGLHPFLKRFEP